MQSSCQELSVKVKNKSQLYDILSKIYYLPDLSSRAATKEYFLKYVYKEPQIFMLKRKEITQHHFRYYKFNALELLEILNKMLKEKNLKPSGLDGSALPNIDWLMNAIVSLDGSDPHELLQPKKEEKTSYQIEVSDE